MVRALKVLFLSAEATPLAKVGGLGDVGGELPRALQARGAEVRNALPRYPSIEPFHEGDGPRQSVTVLRGKERLQATAFLRNVRDVEVLLVDGDPVARDPAIYSQGSVEAEKFVFWCLASLQACQQEGWIPDIVHANDWHASAAISWLVDRRRTDPAWAATAGVVTIHNLGYPGKGAASIWDSYGLKPAPASVGSATDRRLPLVAGIALADWITTVSPTYAQEIMTSDFGFGRETLLRTRRARLTGILNGIDPAVWNPETDAALPEKFNADSLDRRAANKASLLDELRFNHGTRTPLLAFIGRLEHQKGIDLFLHALARLLDYPWHAVVLGSGQAELESLVSGFERGHPGRLRHASRFDPELARRIYGAADLVVVPSRYEPCGLVQMIGMRYGCVPVVRATGGLRDTVHEGPAGTGFVFQDASSDGLVAALDRAFAAYADSRSWSALRRRAARRDFSWAKPSRGYLEVYQRALDAVRKVSA
jgi:starch synthase